MTQPRTLALIAARGGSKGFPGKNLADLNGLPLIGHSIECAKLIPGIARCVVTTDDPEIADVARSFGADVPFERPAELASDTAPMAGVIRHGIAEVEREEGAEYDAMLLLDPTSPGRRPDDVAAAIGKLYANPEADGVVSISEPFFDPRWVGVREEDDSVLARSFPEGSATVRRQDLGEAFYRINGSFYVWRARYARAMPDAWFDGGRHLGFKTPEVRSYSIDTEEEFQLVRALVSSGFLKLDWMGS